MLARWLPVAILISACAVEPADHKMWNRSSETVVVVRIDSSGEYLLVSALEPGTFYPWVIGSACPDVVLVARNKAGEEVARRTGPFCPDDEWLIGGPNAQTSAPTVAPRTTPTPVPT
jgi:hypothetical protein